MNAKGEKGSDSRKPCLVLYGNSLFLAGIQAELERDTTLELIMLDAGSPDAMNLICAHRPRAVLCTYPVWELSIPDLVQLIPEESPYPNGARPSPEGFHS